MDGAPEAEGSPPGESRASAAAENPAGDAVFVDAVRIRVSGAIDTTVTLRGEGMSMSGGCTGDSPISLGFSRGNWARDGDRYSYVAFDTDDVVGAGQTGTFPLKEIRWDHGTSVRSVGGREVRLPNRFTGPGTLTLARHDATMAHATAGTRRMTGTLHGDRLINDEASTVRLEAEFDIRLSCGVSSP